MIYQLFSFIATIVIFIICIRCIFIKGGKTNSKYQVILGLYDKYQILLFLGVIFVFILSRFFRLGYTPAGLHIDELGMAYDARCLSQYGTDRHGHHLPVYLEAFGGGQSAMYAYLAALSIKLFGFSVSSIRYPAAMCGFLCLLVSYPLVYEISICKNSAIRSRRLALMGPILVTIIPYFMTSQRWALDCSLFLSIFSVAFYFLLKSIRTNKALDYILAGASMGISLYTYVLSYLVIPIFLILVILYLIYLRKIDIKKIAIMFVPIVVLGIPLLVEQLVCMKIISPFSFLGTDYFSLPMYRVGELSFSNIKNNLANIYNLFYGDEILTVNNLPGYGRIYLYMVPLFLVGTIKIWIDTVKSIVERKYCTSLLINVFAFVSYFILMMQEGFVSYRANQIYLMFMLIIVIGVDAITKETFSLPYTLVILVIFALGYLSFGDYYFRKQNDNLGIQTMFCSTEAGDAVAYVDKYYDVDDSRKIYIELQYDHLAYPDITVGLYGNVSPEDWSEGAERLGRFILHLPDENEYDFEDGSIYIIGNNWRHIGEYIVENCGYLCDDAFPDYMILYKP